MMGFKPLKRLAPHLANLLCGPESSIAREFVIDYYGYLYRGQTNNRIDWCVYFLKNYASAEGRLVKDVGSYLKRTKKPLVCMDIGANVGHRSLVMARIADEVIAVEPMPGACKRLREKIHDNQIRNVRIFQMALDERSNDIELEILSPNNFLAVRRSDVLGRSAYGSKTVAGCRGDDLIEKNRLSQPNFIRIDVGNDTAHVLKGLAQTLRQARPIVLIVCPSGHSARMIDAGSLHALLYDEVELRTFAESVDSGSYTLETIDPQAKKLLCIPSEIVRVAEMEGCKYRSHRVASSDDAGWP